MDLNICHVFATFDEMSLVLVRMCEAVGVASTAELCSMLSISSNVFKEHVEERKIPAKWLHKVFLISYAHPHWLMTGEGEKTL